MTISTLDAVRWLNFKINVLERLIYEKKFEPTKNEIESAVDATLANDVEYAATVKMLNKFIKRVYRNNASSGQKTFRHIIEKRLENPQSYQMVAMGLISASDVYETTDIFKDVDLESAIKRFKDKFKK